MKAIKSNVVIFVTLFLLTTFSVNTVSGQPPHAKAYGKHKYYYYPGSNVYYNAGPKLYYYNSGSSWKGVSVLPPGITITTGAPRYIVYHNTPEVWLNNDMHVVKYKANKNKPMKHKKYKKNGKNN